MQAISKSLKPSWVTKKFKRMETWVSEKVKGTSSIKENRIHFNINTPLRKKKKKDKQNNLNLVGEQRFGLWYIPCKQGMQQF